MDCSKFRDLVDLYVADELEELNSEECRMHAETCEECGNLLEEARAAAERVAGAMKEARPGEGFEDSVRERLRLVPREEAEETPEPVEKKPVVRRLVYVAAAAVFVAAVAGAGVFLYTNMQGERVIFGELAGGTGRVRPGVRYETAKETGVELHSGARILLSAQSSFEADEARLHLHAGRCYAATMEGVSDTAMLTRLVTEGLSAELGGGAEVFLCAGTGEGGDPGAGGAMSSVVDALFPRAYAAGPSGRVPLFLVFAGSAKVRCDGKEFAVVEGQGIFADGSKDGPFDTEELVKSYGENIAKAEAMVKSLSDRIALYTGVVESYEKTLKERHDRRDDLIRTGAKTVEDRTELAEVEKRIRIVTDAKKAHEKRISEWKLVVEGERRARVTDMRQKLDVMKSALDNHRSAMTRLTR